MAQSNHIYNRFLFHFLIFSRDTLFGVLFFIENPLIVFILIFINFIFIHIILNFFLWIIINFLFLVIHKNIIIFPKIIFFIIIYIIFVTLVIIIWTIFSIIISMRILCLCIIRLSQRNIDPLQFIFFWFSYILSAYRCIILRCLLF